MPITYLRVRETFEVTSTAKFPAQRNQDISQQIIDYLDSFGTSDWELVHYAEQFRSEDIFDITAVFKK